MSERESLDSFDGSGCPPAESTRGRGGFRGVRSAAGARKAEIVKPIPSPNDPDGHSTRPFIFPLSSLAEVQAEYDDTLRLIDQATSRRPVSTVRLGEYLAGQYRWLERLQDQIEQMEAAA